MRLLTNNVNDNNLDFGSYTVKGDRKYMKDLLKHITFNKDVLCGKPLIRGMRISVEMILELLVNGATEQEIIEDYPELEVEDIRAAILYAHHIVANEIVLDSVAVT